MYGENLRKFTETRARAALASCGSFFATKNTVQLSNGVYTATSDATDAVYIHEYSFYSCFYAYYYGVVTCTAHCHWRGLL